MACSHPWQNASVYFSDSAAFVITPDYETLGAGRGGEVKQERERSQILSHMGFFIVIFEVCLAQRQIVHLPRVTRT